jgi:hypothetical protein
MFRGFAIMVVTFGVASVADQPGKRTDSIRSSWEHPYRATGEVGLIVEIAQITGCIAASNGVLR